MAHYIHKDDFTFELIVCKGKGKVSPKLSEMFWLIATKLITKPQFNIVEYHDDQIMEGYTTMMSVWYNVNFEKYDKTLLPYFTEIAKRSFVKIYNTYQDRTQYNDAPKIYSFSNFENIPF